MLARLLLHRPDNTPEMANARLTGSTRAAFHDRIISLLSSPEPSPHARRQSPRPSSPIGLTTAAGSSRPARTRAGLNAARPNPTTRSLGRSRNHPSRARANPSPRRHERTHRVLRMDPAAGYARANPRGCPAPSNGSNARARPNPAHRRAHSSLWIAVHVRTQETILQDRTRATVAPRRTRPIPPDPRQNEPDDTSPLVPPPSALRTTTHETSPILRRRP